MQVPITDLKEFVTNNPWIKRLRTETFGIILPNGWLGRPFDNQHKITNISILHDRITIVFDNIREIHVLKPKAYDLQLLNTNWSSMKILGCQEIMLIWIPYGEEQTGKTIVKKFQASNEDTLELVGYFPPVP